MKRILESLGGAFVLKAVGSLCRFGSRTRMDGVWSFEWRELGKLKDLAGASLGGPLAAWGNPGSGHHWP